MHKNTRLLLATGCLLTCLGIVLGAFGAHGVEDRVEPYFFKVYQTASRFHMYNALGLILIGLIHHQVSLPGIKWITRLLYAGILIFCGTLYLLGTSPLWSAADMRWLGAITPIGGVCMISAWLITAIQLYQKNKNSAT